jgi:hypothetical protein
VEVLCYNLCVGEVRDGVSLVGWKMEVGTRKKMSLKFLVFSFQPETDEGGYVPVDGAGFAGGVSREGAKTRKQMSRRKCLIFRRLPPKPAFFGPFIAFKGLISRRLRRIRPIIHKMISCIGLRNEPGYVAGFAIHRKSGSGRRSPGSWHNIPSAPESCVTDVLATLQQRGVPIRKTGAAGPRRYAWDRLGPPGTG